MRKFNDYYYKTYDKQYNSEIERIDRECFNEYGYNFDSNKRRIVDYNEIACKTRHKRVNSSKEK